MAPDADTLTSADARPIDGPSARGGERSAESNAPRRFVWPPRPMPGPASSANDGALQPRDTPPRGVWSQCEHVWLDLVAPPLAQRCEDTGWSPDPLGAYCWRCGRSAGEFAVGADGCSACEGEPAPWARVVRLGEYAAPLNRLIREVKFTAFRRLGVDLGVLLGAAVARTIREETVEGRLAPGTRVEFVPVPTSFRRRVARGLDHAAAIARGAAIGAERAGAGPCRVYLDLARSHRPSQVTVPTSQRRRNVAGTMKPSLWGRFRRWRRGDPGSDRPRLVVLVDDVMTTGATMREACRAYRCLFGLSDTMWAGVLGVTAWQGGRIGHAEG